MSSRPCAGQTNTDWRSSGAASGLSSGAVSTSESVVIALTRMMKLELNPVEREAWAEAEPGLITARVTDEARAHGLIYPPDPASYRTSIIGGNIAENAGGPMCFKRGVTGDYVKEIEFVTADGGLHRATRDFYDVCGLLIGSEGTLALITGARLRLDPPADFTRTLMAHFGEVGVAARAVSRPPSRAGRCLRSSSSWTGPARGRSSPTCTLVYRLMPRRYR